MIEGGIGGSSTGTGLVFEKASDFLTLLDSVPGYSVSRHATVGYWVLFNNKKVARTFKKNEFYRYLDEIGIEWKSKISKKLLPDDAILVIIRDTLFIIEVKYQQVPGSVDEKLQTCHYKKLFYMKLMAGSGILIEYVYVLNSSWFYAPGYKDVLEYITSVGCHYYFDKLPLKWLGLPTPED